MNDANRSIKIIDGMKVSNEKIEPYTLYNMHLDMALDDAKLSLKKQIPKKPSFIERDWNYYVCASCGESIYSSDSLETHKFCLECGQAVDWREEDE